MAYERIDWENEPSVDTPLNEDNLNHMDEGIANLDSDVAGKMDANNPTGTGSLQVGTGNMKTDGNPSYALGYNAYAEGDNSFAFGSSTRAKKQGAYAIGTHAEAREYFSMALGEEVIAASIHQTVRGKYNEIDADGVYLDIVGGGNPLERKNVETLTPNGDKWVAGELEDGFGNKLSGLAKMLELTASGDVVSVNAYPSNAKDLKVTMLPIQASGTPSPSNPLPISGRNSVGVNRCSQNFMPSATTKSGTLNNITYSTENGVYTFSGVANALTIIDFPLTNGFIIPNANDFKLCLKNTVSSSSSRLEFYNGDTLIDYWSFSVADRVITTYSAMSGIYCDKVSFRIEQGVTFNITVSPMFLLSADDSSVFIPSNFERKAISLGQTVYGGVLDVTTGVLTIDWVRMDIDPSTSFIGTSTGGLSWHDFTVNAVDGFGMSNKLKYIVNESTAWLSTTPCFTINSDGKIRIYANPATFATDYADTYIVYKAATPSTVQLTPTAVALLEGLNNVFSEDGSVELTYLPESILPPLPPADGSYTLKATVSGGSVSLAWDDGNGNRNLSKGGSDDEPKEEEVKKEPTQEK